MRSTQLSILIFILALYSARVLGQEDASGWSPDYKLMRAEEDYSFLKKNTSDEKILSSIKYLPLGKISYLSIGGNLRSEVQHRINEDWEQQKNTALFQRFMMHSSLHVTKSFRVFTELKAGYTVGRENDFFLDNDEIDFHQLFAELKLQRSKLRLGRQELSLGARRLVSLREGTNIRQSFDGFRILLNYSSWKIDLLGFAYNPQRPGAFDNRINTDELLWGLYVTRNIQEKDIKIEFYYLGFRNEFAEYPSIFGVELRHSLGTRWSGTINKLELNNEAVFQLGQIADQNILAWTISFDMNYLLESTLIPKFGLKLDLISGDSRQTDRLTSFNPLYPRGGYFGLLALVGPSNLIDIHPSIVFSLSDRFSIKLDYDLFWRFSLDDGIYFPSGRLNRAPGNSKSRFIGHQPGIQFEYLVNSNISVEASAFHFFNGGFVSDITQGNEISLLTFTTGIAF